MRGRPQSAQPKRHRAGGVFVRQSD
jgi:hypothetical protein